MVTGDGELSGTRKTAKKGGGTETQTLLEISMTRTSVPPDILVCCSVTGELHDFSLRILESSGIFIFLIFQKS